MYKIFRLYYFFFAALLTAASLALEYDLISLQKVRLKQLQIPSRKQKDHHFVFIIPSYNCADIAPKILNGIFSQTYSDFEVRFIDDGSTDLTYHVLSEYKEEHPDYPLTVIRHEKRKGAVLRLYEAAHQVKDDDIIVYMKGNAWLSHEKALEKIHSYYKNHDIWYLFSSHINYRTKKVGGELPWSIHNALRRKSFEKSRLKTFYASLFKKIKPHDFFFRGTFISDQDGESYIFPLMEMAHQHSLFVKEPLASYIQRDLVEEIKPSFHKKLLRKLQAKKPYAPLSSLHRKEPPPSGIDVLVFSRQTPFKLYAFLESAQLNLKGTNNITVFYQPQNSSLHNNYKALKKLFPDITFYAESDEFPHLLNHCLQQKESSHILLATDEYLFQDAADLTTCASLLEEVGGSFFSLALGKNSQQDPPLFLEPAANCLMWVASGTAKGSWDHRQLTQMRLYRKEDLLQITQNLHFQSIETLEKAWLQKKPSFTIGLSFPHSKGISGS